MKKIFVLLAVAFMAASAGYAQSAIELAKQQRELDKVNMDMLNAKPSKLRRNRRSNIRKTDGWYPPAVCPWPASLPGRNSCGRN